MKFTYQLFICSDYQDMTQISMSFNDFENITVRRNDYRINFQLMTKNETVNRTQNADLSEKSGQLQL